jgi:hypothetical protein
MRILVACEESGAVTKEFRLLGHEAYSCDLVETSGGHPEWHLQTDVRELLKLEWDMIVAFPSCTHLACSGARHFEKKKADGRQQEGIDFFMLFANHRCPRICIENPIGIMSKLWRKPDQIIQPWQFGDEAQKSTCLWLKGLPLLVPTNIVGKGDFYVSPSGKKLPDWYNKNSITDGNGNRQKSRSKTFPGIAKAIATQFDRYVRNVEPLESLPMEDLFS